MIAGRSVLWLGLAQLISWGITYYLIGGFGDAMTADLGWGRDAVYAGFSWMRGGRTTGRCSPRSATGRAQWVSRHSIARTRSSAASTAPNSAAVM